MSSYSTPQNIRIEALKRILLLPLDAQILAVERLTNIGDILTAWNYRSDTGLFRGSIDEAIDQAINLDYRNYPLRPVLRQAITKIEGIDRMFDRGDEVPFLAQFYQLREIDLVAVQRIADVIALANLPYLKAITIEYSKEYRHSIGLINIVSSFLEQYIDGPRYCSDRNNSNFNGLNERSLSSASQLHFYDEEGGNVEIVGYQGISIVFELYFHKISQYDHAFNYLSNPRLKIVGFRLDTISIEEEAINKPQLVQYFTQGYLNLTLNDVENILSGNDMITHNNTIVSNYYLLLHQINNLDLVTSGIDYVFAPFLITQQLLTILYRPKVYQKLTKLRIPLDLLTMVEYSKLLDRYPKLNHLGIDLRTLTNSQLKELPTILESLEYLGRDLIWTLFGYSRESKIIGRHSTVNHYDIIFLPLLAKLQPQLKNRLEFAKLDVFTY